MHVISRRQVREWASKHSDAASALERWFDLVSKAQWRTFDELRMVLPHADEVRVASGRVATVFNIRGNKYRLIAAIHYNAQRLFTLRFLTHAEYDKNDWKGQL